MRQRLALVFALLLPGAAAGAVGHPTLERQVMVGYQGWFRTPGDGSGLGWAHYAGTGAGPFGPGHLGIDFWPDVSEFPAGESYSAPFPMADGAPAQVFSSHNPQTVARHFRWMRDYGIDGAFVQRFPATFGRDDARSRLRRKAADDVLEYARAGAEQAGRSFAVMYDLSGVAAGGVARVRQDWRHLVDDLKIRASPAYQGHRGKPVVAVWGVGFNDGRSYTLGETEDLIDFFKNDPADGGNTVMLGIPTWWREGTGDAIPDPRLPLVLQKADILSPWTPGRYDDLGGVRAHAERFWGPDRVWCAARGLDYMPVVFPGFSWKNLKGVGGGIGRNDGRFLWEQYRQLVDGGFTLVYQAMFDEMDEGTQIFKVTDRPPPGAEVGTYRPFPADYYLWLTGTAGDYLHRGQPMPERIVPPPGHPELARYLEGGNEAAYAGAEVSYEAHLAGSVDAPRGVRIALLSDTHTTRGRNEDQALYRGHFDEAIAAVNAAQVDFVLIAGDLTQSGTPEEMVDFKAQAKTLQAPVFWVPGNHDIGGKWMAGPPVGTTAERVAAYEQGFGPSFYVRECAGLRIIGLNSSVLGSGLPVETAEWAFLERELAHPSPVPTLVFMHYAPYVSRPDEPGGVYWNLEPSPRARLLALLHQGGVHLLLTGHLHRQLVNRLDDLLIVTTPPVSFGLPRGKQPEGWTLVTVPPEGEARVEFRTIAH